MTKFFDQLKARIARIAEQNPAGFTFNPQRGAFAYKGYAVASLDTQDCLGKAGLFRVIKFYVRHLDYCIGGWRNEDGTMQFDASKVYMNIEEAIMAAIRNEQRAIFNLNTGKVIMAADYNYYLDCTRMAA